MWEYSVIVEGLVWVPVLAGPLPYTPLYFHRGSFGAKRTSDIIQPQVGQPSTHLHHPPSPHHYLRPSVYTEALQQQILSNKSSQHTNSLISPLSQPSLSDDWRTIALVEEQLWNILSVGWTVSQWTHGHPFKLHLTAICRKQVDFTMLSSQQSVRSNDKIKVVLFSLFRVKKQGVTMYTYWCASKYFRISFVFFVTILKTEVNANNL